MEYSAVDSCCFEPPSCVLIGPLLLLFWCAPADWTEACTLLTSYNCILGSATDACFDLWKWDSTRLYLSFTTGAWYIAIAFALFYSTWLRLREPTTLFPYRYFEAAISYEFLCMLKANSPWIDRVPMSFDFEGLSYGLLCAKIGVWLNSSCEFVLSLAMARRCVELTLICTCFPAEPVERFCFGLRDLLEEFTLLLRL